MAKLVCMLKYPSRAAWAFCAVFILLTSFWYYPKWEKPSTEATLSWDVSGYYMYLPAIFVYHDLKKQAFHTELIQRYLPFTNYDQAFRPPGSANYVMKYSAGQAVQYLPFFLAAHALAPRLGYPADGFSPPYQLAIQIGSVLVALLGLWWVRRALLPRFGEWPTALALLVIVLATNYLNYAAIDGAMTHNWLFTAYAGLLLLTPAFYRRPTLGRALAVGALVGLMTLTRPTEILAVLLPALWGLRPAGAALRERLTFWRQHWAKLLAAALSGAAVVSLQPLYWHYATGQWFVYSYQEQGFSWLHPHLWEGLFSFRAGWLIYSPILLTALVGYAALYRQQPRAFWAMLGFIVLFIYVTFAWDIWWYGGSLGQRAMVQTYAVLAWPLAAALRWLLARPRWAAAWGVAALLGAYYNLWLTHQTHLGGLVTAGDMNRTYFLRVVGRYQVPPDTRLLLDTNAEFTGTPRHSQTLWQQNFEQPDDSVACATPALRGNCSLAVDPAHRRSRQYRIPAQPGQFDWLRVSLQVSANRQEWNTDLMAECRVRFLQGNKIVKERDVHPQRILTPGWPRPVSFDVRAPRQPFDAVLVDFRTLGDTHVLIDDVRIEAFEE